MSVSLQNRVHFHDIDEEAEAPDGFESEREIALRTFQCDGQEQAVSIRLAESNHQLGAASTLLNRMYGWRNYGSDHQLADDAAHATFTASCEGDVIGTITLAVDSPAKLAVDHTFPNEIDRFRSAQGARLCELTKFAFDANASSKIILASLFHSVLLYGQQNYWCTDLFIEVNPRHVRFYENMLGFERMGEVALNSSVVAPSQLMWLKVSEIRAQIEMYRSERLGKPTRSLYPFFFNRGEEKQICARLLHRGAADFQSRGQVIPFREGYSSSGRSVERVLQGA